MNGTEKKETENKKKNDDSIEIIDTNRQRDIPYHGRVPPREDLVNDDTIVDVLSSNEISNREEKPIQKLRNSVSQRYFSNNRSVIITYLSIIVNLILIIFIIFLILNAGNGEPQSKIKNSNISNDSNTSSNLIIPTYNIPLTKKNIFFEKNISPGTSGKIILSEDRISFIPPSNLFIGIINLKTLDYITFKLSEEGKNGGIWSEEFTVANETNQKLHNIKANSNDTLLAVYFVDNKNILQPEYILNTTTIL